MLLAVFAGGMLGTLARLGLLEALPADPLAFPWATFAANVAGAFLLGLVGRDRPLLGPGFCGALTTFSTLQLELLEMLDAGALGLAAAYVVASLAAGLVAVALGTRMAAR